MLHRCVGNWGMLAFALLPILHSGQNGTPISLNTLDLSAMRQDYGSPRKDRSCDGKPITIAGKVYTTGIGTHANSEWSIPINRNGVRFHAWVGVDDEQEGKGSVRFQVIADGKILADTGVMKGNDPAKEISVDLKGVRNLELNVDDGGDGINYDHADWADATLVLVNAKKPIKFAMEKAPTLVIAKPDLNKVQINGPRAIGCTAGHDFLFRIPATGKNLTFSAENLPSGVSLDAKTGIISGVVREKGDYRVKVSVVGDKGKDSREILIAANGLLALTPPMGWNSWNVWGLSVDADKVRAAADSFVSSGLAAYGYQYINIDDGWEAEKRADDGEIVVNHKFNDMKPVSDYVHSQGLKMGIYSSPGPRTCGGYLGSWEHEAQDAATYGKWGIDYLKYDWCSYYDISRGDTLYELQKPYLTMKRGLDESGRDIVFSLCQYGMGDVYKWGGIVGGNLWRTTGDINDSWNSMAGIGFDHSKRSPYVKPGGWNDPDMLVVGSVGWGPSVRPTNLTPNEQITHITLWSMLAAPLLIGCDLTKLDDFTKSVLMNHDVIEVDQDPLGKAATRLSQVGSTEIWTRPLFDGSVAVALFNRGRSTAEVTVTMADLKLSGAKKVRDLWQQKDLGKLSSIKKLVPPHGAYLFKIQ